MNSNKTVRIGLDVGGANLKAADGSGEARSIPFELWKRPERLADELRSLFSFFPPFDEIAMTTTAELCDCFETKREGVESILAHVLSAAEGRRVRVWGTDQRFHDPAEIVKTPAVAAAANWVALAAVAADLRPRGAGILIDVGSTTTDLIPLKDGRIAARGLTDPARLRTGELVYAGTRRTPVCALATSLEFRGGPVGLAAEVFATTLDVYLTLGTTPPDPTDEATADGRPATVEAARGRLSRMIGADRDEFSDEDAVEFARAAHEVLLDRLRSAAARACGASVGRPAWAVVSGSGEFLAREAARGILPEGAEIVGLGEAWGNVASTAACAYALALLAERDAGAVDA